MGTYRRHHNPVILDDIELLKNQVRRDMFDGNESPTRIVLSSMSGTIDPFTEEIINFEAPTYFNASGVVGQVTVDDVLLGLGGKVVTGDTTVVYHYDVISGVFLQHQLNKVELLAVAVSGLYHVIGYVVETFANRPLFLNVALRLDSND